MSTEPETNQNQPKQQRSSALAVGAVSLLASALFRQIIGLISLGVTARILTPSDFGIVAYFLFFITLLEALQRQATMALIRIPELTISHVNTVFTLRFILGLIGSFVFWFFKPVLGFMGVPEVSTLLPAISAYSVLIGLRNPKLTLFERELKFSYAVKEETISKVAYSTTAVVLAWLWPSYWALITASFVAGVIHGGYTYYAAPMFPRFTLARWRDSLVFSLWAMSAQLVQIFASALPMLFIGAKLGMSDAGVYRLGTRVTDIVTVQFFAPLQRVIYPGLADISRSAGKSTEAFIRLNSMLLAIVMPLGVGAALIAEDTIVYVLGEKWRVAAYVIWVMAPLKSLETLNSNVIAASFVDGSVRQLFMRNAVLLVLSGTLMSIGVQYEFVGALVGAAFSSVMALATTLVLARKFGRGGYFEPLTVAWRSFFSCAIMVLALTGLSVAFETQWPTLHPLLLIFSKVVIGITTYIGAHLILWISVGRPDGFETQLFNLAGRLGRHLRPAKEND